MFTLSVKKLNFVNSIVGLIGKKNPEPVFIKTRFGIHTFGLKYSIDILVLEKSGKEENVFKIVQIKKNLSPNRLFFWNFRYSHLIEIPIINKPDTIYNISDYIKVEEK